MTPRELFLNLTERRRVALAALEILEHEHLARLAQIRADKRSLLAGELK